MDPNFSRQLAANVGNSDAQQLLHRRPTGEEEATLREIWHAELARSRTDATRGDGEPQDASDDRTTRTDDTQAEE